MNTIKKEFFTKETLKEKQIKLNETVQNGKFISVQDYLIARASVIDDFNLDQKKDANEIEIRTIDILLKEEEGE